MQTRDRIVSFGERLSVRTFAEAFNSSRKDPQDDFRDKMSVDVPDHRKADSNGAFFPFFPVLASLNSELPAFLKRFLLGGAGGSSLGCLASGHEDHQRFRKRRLRLFFCGNPPGVLPRPSAAGVRPCGFTTL